MIEVRAAVKNYYRGRFSEDAIREMHSLRNAGWSQSQIAAKFGVQQSYISRILTGKRRKDVKAQGEAS